MTNLHGQRRRLSDVAVGQNFKWDVDGQTYQKVGVDPLTDHPEAERIILCICLSDYNLNERQQIAGDTLVTLVD
jgi:hypothetical protein